MDSSMTIQAVTRILDALQLYIDRFGMPESEVELKETLGALLAVMAETNLAPAEVDAWIEGISAVFQQRQQLKPTLETMVETARQMLKQREEQLTGVVSGYVQKFAPQIQPTELMDVVETAIAILCDRTLSASEAKGLAAKVLKTFDLDLALRRWVPPELVTVAQQVANYRQHNDIESTLMSVIQAYIQKFGALLSPELIQEILEKGSGNIDPKALLTGDLATISDTIFIRFQLRKATPQVTKSAEVMADQIHSSIEAFRHRRQRDGEGNDINRPIALGDLEVGSAWFEENDPQL